MKVIAWCVALTTPAVALRGWWTAKVPQRAEMATTGSLAATVLDRVEESWRPRVPAPRRKSRVAVFLLNLGGPETLDDVEPFLYNLFADPDIIRLPSAMSGIQTALAWLVAKRRAPRSREAYDSIGGGSPITRFTTQQAALLEESLNADSGESVEFRCYVAMRYWHPFTDEALARATRDECDCAVVLPLYPHFSISTTGSSLRALLAEMQASQPELMARHTVVPSWHDSLGYVNVMSRLVADEIKALRADAGKAPTCVLFSAHGVPVSYIERAGDPYKRHVERTVALVARGTSALIGDADDIEFELSFQSRVGPVEWLRPYTDDALEALAARGVRRVVVVPVSFVSEHIETLEEIDVEYRDVAINAGITHWRRVPALNLDKDFISELKTLVNQALYVKPVVSTSEACVVNSFDLDDRPLGVLTGVERDVELLNTRTAAVAIALTLLLELFFDTKALHLFGV